MHDGAYTADEMMTVAAARALKDGTVCFVGIGLPSAAANLARLTHAPNIVLIYESGTIGTKPNVLPLSIGDGELAETADALVSVPEMFRYWLQGGRIDVGFLGAAQLDRYGNINTTVIGPYDRPKVRLPGAGGASEIATSANEIFIMLRQGPRAFVDKLDFVTSVGFATGGDSRARLGVKTKGPTFVVSDLGILTPDPETYELTLDQPAPGRRCRAREGRDRLAAQGRVEARDDAAADPGRARGAARAQRADRARPWERRLMRDFVYDMLPGRVVFGIGALDRLAEEVDKLGKRALVLSTPEQQALAEDAAHRLGARAVGVFPRAAMHVPIEVARAARDEAKRLDADCYVALGGGSTIGLGKAIALETALPVSPCPPPMPARR